MTRTIAIACCLALASAAAAAPPKERWRLGSVPLDMPEDGGLDDQALEGLYQGDYGTGMPHNFGGSLGGKVKDSVLTESPFWHIDTTLQDGRRLQLWFSSAEDGRKVFGARLSVPWSGKPGGDASRLFAELESAYGKPDLELERSAGKATQRIQVTVDRTMPQERQDAVRARFPAAAPVSAKDVESFWQADLREWARILGPDFRGVVVVAAVEDGKVQNQQATLIDLARARTVFNLVGVK